MTARPSTIPVLDTNQTNRVAPAGSKQTDGYVLNDIFPANNANYLHGWAGDWLTWLDERTADGTTPLVDLVLQGLDATSGVGGSVSLLGGDGVSGNGGDITITAGLGNLTGNGGSVDIDAGDSGATAGALSGQVNINAGDGNASNAVGGRVWIFAGNGGPGTGAAGGDLEIRSGTAGGTNANGGDNTMRAGGCKGTGIGGAIEILGGETQVGSVGTGGGITIRAGGQQSSNGSQGGAVTIEGGQGGGTNRGGDVDITAGESTSNTIGGDINITGGESGSVQKGGQVNILGGLGGSSNGIGGDVVFQGGRASGSDRSGGTCMLKGGEGRGNNGSTIEFHIAEDNQGAGGVLRTPVIVSRMTSQGMIFAKPQSTHGNGIPAAALEVVADSADEALRAYRESNTTTNAIAQFYSDVTSTETLHCQIMTDGDLENTNNSYTGISDITEKEHVAVVGSKEAKLVNGNLEQAFREIDAIEFSLKEHVSRGPMNCGFSAQDVQKIMPHLVRKSTLRKGKLALNQVGMVPILWQMVKTLITRVEELEGARA